VGVLGEIDGGQHCDRRADQHRQTRHVHRRDNRRTDAALGVHPVRSREDELRRQHPDAVDEDVHDDRAKEADRDAGRDPQDAHRKVVGDTLVHRF